MKIWVVFCLVLSIHSCRAAEPLSVDGKVLILDESNFDSAISSFDHILVDFYAPWCGHCKRLSPELDAAAPVLAKLKEPILIAKVDADKHTRLARKHEVDAYPTILLFNHGVPTEYRGPRKADLLVRYLKKFAASDVSVLDSDSAVNSFVEEAGTFFPVFIGFGLDSSIIEKFGIKYKKNAWFSVAKDFSEDLMITYDFDKIPALVSLNQQYNERNTFYGPFEGMLGGLKHRSIHQRLTLLPNSLSCYVEPRNTQHTPSYKFPITWSKRHQFQFQRAKLIKAIVYIY